MGFSPWGLPSYLRTLPLEKDKSTCQTLLSKAPAHRRKARCAARHHPRPRAENLAHPARTSRQYSPHFHPHAPACLVPSWMPRQSAPAALVHPPSPATPRPQALSPHRVPATEPLKPPLAKPQPRSPVAAKYPTLQSPPERPHG